MQLLEQVGAGPHGLALKHVHQLVKHLVPNVKVGAQGPHIVRGIHPLVDGANNGGGAVFKGGSRHGREGHRDGFSALRPPLLNDQRPPFVGQLVGRNLRRAIDGRLLQNPPDECNAPRLGFYKHPVRRLVVRLLSHVCKPQNVEVDGAVLVLERQTGVRAVAQTPPDDLLDAAHIVPRIQDVNLAHVLEIHTFRDERRRHHDANEAAVHVFGAADRADQRPNLGGRHVGRQKAVLARRRTRKLARRVFQEGQTNGGLVPVLLERHRKLLSPAPHQVGKDKDNARGFLNALEHGRELGGVAADIGGAQKGRNVGGVAELRPSRVGRCEKALDDRAAVGRGHDRRGHERRAFGPCGFFEQLRLLRPVVGHVGHYERQVLAGHSDLDAPIIGLAINLGNHWRRGRQAEREGKGILAPNEGYIVVAVSPKPRLGVGADKRAVGLEKESSRQLFSRSLPLVVPQKQIQ